MLLAHPKLIGEHGGKPYFLGDRGVYEKRSGMFYFIPRGDLPDGILRAANEMHANELRLLEILEEKEESGPWYHDGACLPNITG